MKQDQDGTREEAIYIAAIEAAGKALAAKKG